MECLTAFEGEGAKASLFSSFYDTPSQHRPEGTGVEADHAVKAWPAPTVLGSVDCRWVHYNTVHSEGILSDSLHERLIKGLPGDWLVVAFSVCIFRDSQQGSALPGQPAL